MKTLDQHVKEMRTLSRQLVPYSFPKVPPQDEEALSPLKQRQLIVDGYKIIAFFSVCSYGDIELETLQIYGKDFTFLPFTIICKCARKFLGDNYLSYVEVDHPGEQNQNSRRIYIWTVYYDVEGNPMSMPFLKDVKDCCFEGLKFSQIEQGKINLI